MVFVVLTLLALSVAADEFCTFDLAPEFTTSEECMQFKESGQAPLHQICPKACAFDETKFTLYQCQSPDEIADETSSGCCSYGAGCHSYEDAVQGVYCNDSESKCTDDCEGSWIPSSRGLRAEWDEAAENSDTFIHEAKPSWVPHIEGLGDPDCSVPVPVCDPTQLGAMIYQQHEAGALECEPILSAFQGKGEFTQETTCDCVKSINQEILDEYQCYLFETDSLMVSELKQSSYCQLCDQTELGTAIYQQVLNGISECEPAISALQTGDLSYKALCDCVEMIDQPTLDKFQCYIFETNFVPVNQLKTDYCPREPPLLTNYDCTYNYCGWEGFTQGEDYDIYTSDGNCEDCAERCTQDPKCRAMECGSNYCSWWRDGKCTIDDSIYLPLPFFTCRSTIDLCQCLVGDPSPKCNHLLDTELHKHLPNCRLSMLDSENLDYHHEDSRACRHEFNKLTYPVCFTPNVCSCRGADNAFDEPLNSENGQCLSGFLPLLDKYPGCTLEMFETGHETAGSSDSKTKNACRTLILNDLRQTCVIGDVCTCPENLDFQNLSQQDKDVCQAGIHNLFLQFDECDLELVDNSGLAHYITDEASSSACIERVHNYQHRVCPKPESIAETPQSGRPRCEGQEVEGVTPFADDIETIPEKVAVIITSFDECLQFFADKTNSALWCACHQKIDEADGVSMKTDLDCFGNAKHDQTYYERYMDECRPSDIPSEKPFDFPNVKEGVCGQMKLFDDKLVMFDNTNPDDIKYKSCGDFDSLHRERPTKFDRLNTFYEENINSESVYGKSPLQEQCCQVCCKEGQDKTDCDPRHCPQCQKPICGKYEMYPWVKLYEGQADEITCDEVNDMGVWDPEQYESFEQHFNARTAPEGYIGSSPLFKACCRQCCASDETVNQCDPKVYGPCRATEPSILTPHTEDNTWHQLFAVGTFIALATGLKYVC